MNDKLRRLRHTLTTNGWRYRIGFALTIVAAIVIFYAIVYRWAMATFEGETVPIYKAVQVVIESLTTAGFGGHAPWESMQMNLFVLLMNLTGVLLVFLALPVFAIPLFRKAIESGPPKTSDQSDHVIICSYTAHDEVLRRELERVGVPYLIVDQDPDVVTELLEKGINAIHGNPEKVETLRAANATQAQALVADVDDETNPTVILSATRVNPDLHIVSLVRAHEEALYHKYAGADEVVNSRKQLGESLGMRSIFSFSEKLRDAIEVDTDLRVTELVVEETSDLVGQSLQEASIFDRTGVTIIGIWMGGKFIASPDPETVIEENTILLAAGNNDGLRQVNARPTPMHEDDSSRIIVGGYGATGQAVVETLRNEGVDVEVIDIEDKDGVDIVGNVANRETLEKAGLEDARAIVLTMDEDNPTIYATLITKQTAPDVEVIARADRSENVWKLYNAGADFVLSLPTVTGEILASLLAEDADILTPQTTFIRTEAPEISGQTLDEVDLRKNTGCTVVAVERSGDLLTEIGPDFTVQEGDTLVAAGSEEATTQFIQFVSDRETKEQKA